jgi:exonuclease SbcC
MRIDKISISGFTTFNQPASLDLAALGPGIIAIAGPNGSGKTTLLEAIPGAIYRQTPSRGSIATLATSRESSIELIGENGAPFQIRLSADAHNGKQEAIILDGAGEAKAGPKVRDFDAYVAAHFAPLDVYLASFFSSQTGAGSIFKMDRSSRRALFGRLLGIERLELMATAARENARAKETELAASRAALDALRDQAEDVAALMQQLEAARANAETAKALQEETQDKLDQARTCFEIGQRAADEAEKGRARLAEASRRAKVAADEVSRLDSRLFALENLLGEANKIRAIAARIRELTAELEKNRAAGEIAAAEDRLFQDKSSAADRRHVDANLASRKARQEIDDAERKHKEAVTAIANAEASTGAVPCAGALDDAARGGCPALSGHFRNKERAEQVIKWYVENIFHLTSQLDLAHRDEADAAEAAERARKASVSVRAEIEKLRAEYVRIRGEIEKLRLDDRTAELDKAEAEASALRASLVTAGQALDAAKAEAARIQAEIPVVDHLGLQALEKDIRDISATVGTLRQGYEHDTAEAVRIETRLNAAAQAQTKTEELIAKIRPSEREISDWKFLARGLGREGVQALELDAAGPRVSDLANELLADAYGPRFQVRFETQAAKADGKGVKETFDIIVVDNERGREGDGEDLSGGEKVIVGEALGLAVGLFHAQAAGANLGTVIRDETVGALDPENGQRYLAMLRAFLRVGRVHQLLFVAHQPALVDLADAVVRIENGRISLNG